MASIILLPFHQQPRIRLISLVGALALCLTINVALFGALVPSSLPAVAQITSISPTLPRRIYRAVGRGYHPAIITGLRLTFRTADPPGQVIAWCLRWAQTEPAWDVGPLLVRIDKTAAPSTLASGLTDVRLDLSYIVVWR